MRLAARKDIRSVCTGKSKAIAPDAIELVERTNVMCASICIKVVVVVVWLHSAIRPT